MKYHITNHLKRHQLELFRSNKNLCFYSIFKTDVSKSDYSEQVKNLKHRRAVAKLNYDQAITVLESNLDDTVYLNYRNLLGFVNTAALTKLRTRTISYFIVIVITLLDNK